MILSIVSGQVLLVYFILQYLSCGSGSITKARLIEVMKVLGEDLTPDEAQEMLTMSRTKKDFVDTLSEQVRHAKLKAEAEAEKKPAAAAKSGGGGGGGGGSGGGGGGGGGGSGPALGTVALKDDPEYGKFFKMLKMNIPRPAVENKMRQAGLDISFLDKDPNSMAPEKAVKASGAGGGGGAGPGGMPARPRLPFLAGI